MLLWWTGRALAIRYGFINTLVVITATSNPTPQSTDAARTEKQARKDQDTTAAAGPESSKKVSPTMPYGRLMLQGLQSEPERTKVLLWWTGRALAIRYGFINALITVTASNHAPQSTDAARTENQAQARKDHNTTAAPEKAGPESSKSLKVSPTMPYG